MAKKQTLTTLIFQQNILTLLLLTLVVVAVWVGFSIYFSFSRTTVTPTDAALIAPLTPRLDSALFERLSARKSWSEAELSSFQPTVVVTTVPGASPTPRPIATPVATVSATPVASPSAGQ